MFWAKEERIILKLPKALQDMLFGVAADTFESVQVGRSYWSYVEIENLTTDELAHYVEEAWKTVAPKHAIRELAGNDARTTKEVE